MANRDGTEGSASGMPEVTVEPSGGVMGLNQRNVYEERCPLENSSVISHGQQQPLLVCVAA